MSDAIYPYHMGGKEVRYHNLCPRLARNGFDVHVFTMNWWGGNWWGGNWWGGPRSRREDGVRFTAVSPCVPLYVGDRRSILQAVVFSLGCFQLLWHRFDVLEADHMPYLPLFPLRIVATLKRVPLVVTWHEVWGREYWREYLGRAGRVGAALERLAMHLPDQIIAVNLETRARLIDEGVPDSRVSVLPNGVDVDEIASVRPSERAFDVIYVGRLLEHKRVGDLVGAVGRLAAEGLTVSCAVIGTGPERENLERRVAASNLIDQVRFLGSFEDHDTVFGLMKSSRLLVLPSVREGFGIVVLEAFVCGVPVITTDHPDNKARLLVDHGVTGWLTQPTAEALASVIRTALTEPLDPERNRDVLERCDWNRIAAQLAEIPLDGGGVGRVTTAPFSIGRDGPDPVVTVVVCTCRRPEKLDVCLTALDRQSIRDRIEVVVVDDGPDERTAAVAASHAVRFLRHEVNRGLSAARNTGIAAARAPIIAFTDDDCVPAADWLEALVSQYDDPDAVGVGGRVVALRHTTLVHRYLARTDRLAPLEIELGVSNSIRYRALLYLRRNRGRRLDLPAVRPVYSLVGANMSFRAEALRAIGRFDARITFGGEDEDICRRLRERFPDSRLDFTADATVAHDFEGDLSDTLRRSFQYGGGSARSYLKNADQNPTLFPVPVLVAALCLLGARRRASLVAAVAVPFLVFSHWPIEAVRRRRLELLAYPYVQLLEEVAHDVGFARGWLRLRRQYRSSTDAVPVSQLTRRVDTDVGMNVDTVA